MHINVNLQFNRVAGDQSWDLPAWGHALSMGVFPLFVVEERQLILTGTAFCISRIGILSTALHNILETYRVEGLPTPVLLGPLATSRPKIQLRRAGLAVFHQQQTHASGITGSVWPLETVDAAPPTDLAYCFPQFQTGFPYLHLPITFDLPRIGSKVTCIGYTKADGGSEQLDMNTLTSGKLDVAGGYSHRFHAVEATVTDVFTRRFLRGYLPGPCFSIDANVPPGLSGGPVFSESGYVCGVVSAGAESFFQTPATLISPFYPTLLSQIRFGASTNGLRFDAIRKLIDLIGSGAITSDGSEEHLVVIDGPMVCPRIASEDRNNVHDDFNAYQAGSGATQVTEDGHSFRRRPRPSAGGDE